MCLDILFDKNSIQSKEQLWMTKSFIGKNIRPSCHTDAGLDRIVREVLFCYNGQDKDCIFRKLYRETL